MELTENTLVADRFRLVRKLGEGGMGSVWLARHELLGTQCAVKFIHAEVADASGVRERFHREAKIAAQLKSPYVVGVLDYGIWSGDPYLAMEYLEGEDLGQRLEHRKRLSPVETFAITSQVARALAKAHGMGLVHRDLKPENVFLTREDDGERVKVLDFGIAKTLSNSVNVQTQTGAMLGTPRYMSPEQAEGKKTVDHRSDLWALGVIVFRCLVGTLPFDSDALGDLLMRIMVHPLPMPSRLAPGLPATFDAWWTKAAARNPDQRFQSATELVEALADALGLANTPRLSTPSSDLAFASTAGMPSTASPPTSPQAPLIDLPQRASPAHAQTPWPAQPTITDPRLATSPTQVTPAPHVTMSTVSRTFHGAEPKRKSAALPLVAVVFLAIGALGTGAFLLLKRSPNDATADTTAPTTIALPTTVAASPTLAPDPTSNAQPIVVPQSTAPSPVQASQPAHTVARPAPPSPPPPSTARPARTGKVHIGTP